MKELTDKAKAYDKAIERAEDERVRKEIIYFLNRHFSVWREDIDKYKSWLAWLEKVGEIVDYYEDKLDKCACDYFNKGYKKALEKQGEQEETLCDKCKKEQPSHSCQDITALGRCALEKQSEKKLVDKVEPKFKVGDWIIHNKNTELANSLMLVTGKDNNEYLCKYKDGQCSYNIEFIDKEYRLWTIQDAKDGDVLVDEDNNIGIYKEIEGIYWDSYIYLGCDGKLRGFSIGGKHEQTNTHPATKEQRDTLLKAMTDAGYTFDFEQKELKKIEQNPAWSKEDEKMIDNIIFELEENQENISGVGYKIDWLKSLKDRVQPQPKWSEEDKQYLLVCKNALYKYQSSNHWDASIIIRWLENKLKSFRPQNYWKPSDEQITWLYRATDEAKKDSRMKQVLNELLSDLKKLREE